MGPMWDYNEAFGLCCGYPIEGYQRGGASNGRSGGSAISPQVRRRPVPLLSAAFARPPHASSTSSPSPVQGWRFSICQEPRRCFKDPIDGVSQWYMRLWRVRSPIAWGRPAVHSLRRLAGAS
jgi:hypothetical protein